MKISHEELLLYASGELPPDRAARVEEALRSDPAARRALAELRDQEAQLARLPLLEPGRDLVAPALAAARRPRLLVFPAPLLAAAAALLALGGLLWALWLRKPEVQVAREEIAPAPGAIASDEELGERIARLRVAVGGLVSPEPARTAEPEFSPVAGLRGRVDHLKGLCRAQGAGRETLPGSAMDRRVRDLKSRLESARENILSIEIPAGDEIAGCLSTIINAARGYLLQKGDIRPGSDLTERSAS